MKNRRELLAIVAESESEEDYDPKMMIYIVAAAKESGVDLTDRDSVGVFLDSLKALITRDKSSLMAALRKYAKKDSKQLSKLALKA